MRRSVLLALAAAALVAAPQAWAEEHHSNEDHASPQGQRGGPHPGPSYQGQHPGGPQGQAPHFPQGQPQGQGQGQGQHGWGGQPQGQPQGQGQHGWGGQPQGQPQGQPEGQRTWNGQPQGQPQGQGQHGWGGQPQGQPQGQPEGQRTWNGQPQGQHGQPQGVWNGRPGGQGPQTGRWNGQVEQRFDRRASPGQWGQTRNDWRGAHSGWNRGVIWGSNHDWWRGRSEFRDYAGPRVGFWFVPGVGYYSVPQAYWGRHWGYGDYLPRIFLQYQVYDWAAYGLPPPPWGCAWVWIDGGVALVDLSDGYILDVQYGLW